MTLSALIKKGGLSGAKTATPATTATHEADKPVTVAPVATVAVAVKARPLRELSPDEETSIVFYPIVIGIGPIRIIHTACAINADSTSITLKALLIGFFIFGFRI